MGRKYRIVVNGKTYDVDVEDLGAGAAVTAGQLVLVLEAMKMENEIFAPASGAVSEVRCKEGDSVNTGDVLLVVA